MSFHHRWRAAVHLELKCCAYTTGGPSGEYPGLSRGLSELLMMLHFTAPVWRKPEVALGGWCEHVHFIQFVKVDETLMPWKWILCALKNMGLVLSSNSVCRYPLKVGNVGCPMLYWLSWTTQQGISVNTAHHILAVIKIVLNLQQVEGSFLMT